MSSQLYGYNTNSFRFPKISGRLQTFPHIKSLGTRLVSEYRSLTLLFLVPCNTEEEAAPLWCSVWNAKCDKMAPELPESAYSDWTIGTRVMKRVSDNANVITFDGTF